MNEEKIIDELDEKYKNLIQKYYHKFLDREADKEGLKHYLSLLKEKKIPLEELENFFINSLEYKTLHPIKYEKYYSDEQKMKMDWDARLNLQNFPFYDSDQIEISRYWEGGQGVIEKVIGLGTPLFNQMFGAKDLTKLRVLDMGAGLGRVLIPASKIFHEAIGVDVSPEMVNLSKKYIKTNNCKIFENNGKDLSLFSNNYFDFCYSVLTVQHFPKKKNLLDYMKEISRVLKNGGWFRLQIDDRERKVLRTNTWYGEYISSSDIQEFAKESGFKVINEEGEGTEEYWITFLLKEK